MVAKDWNFKVLMLIYGDRLTADASRLGLYDVILMFLICYSLTDSLSDDGLLFLELLS